MPCTALAVQDLILSSGKIPVLEIFVSGSIRLQPSTLCTLLKVSNIFPKVFKLRGNML